VAALAYDRRGCAGTAPVCGVFEPEMVDAAEAEVWLAEGEAALVMGGSCGVCRVRYYSRAPTVVTVRRVLRGAQDYLVALDEAERRKLMR